MSEYRKGSAGAAEEKQNRMMLIAFAVITVLVLGLEFVIPNDIKTSVMDASVIFRVLGGIVTAASWLPIYLGTRTPEDTKKYAIAWIITLVLGLLICIEFGSTVNDYKMH